MEDSSFEGWTTPGPVIGYPEGRRLPSGPRPGHVGELRSLTQATDETIKFAARTWEQREADEFEREGRTWTDRAGVRYTLVRGNPLLAPDASVADLFVVADGELLFLRRADAPTVSQSVHVGTLR